MSAAEPQARVMLCHPVKNAAPDNLLPLGAGAFLNEIDGNLTCAMDNSIIELHWQGKFRGPDFSPIEFTVRTVTHPRLKDSKGRLMPTVVAAHLSEADKAELTQVARSREDELLAAIQQNADASLADLATACGWFQKDGTPYKTLVYRTLDKLKKLKLVTVDERDGIELTEKGKRALKATKPAAKEAKKAAPNAGAEDGKQRARERPAFKRVGDCPQTWCCSCCGEPGNDEKGEVAKWAVNDPGAKADVLHDRCIDRFFLDT